MRTSVHPGVALLVGAACQTVRVLGLRAIDRVSPALRAFALLRYSTLLASSFGIAYRTERPLKPDQKAASCVITGFRGKIDWRDHMDSLAAWNALTAKRNGPSLRY
jgi:hypothetical protein